MIEQFVNLLSKLSTVQQAIGVVMVAAFIVQLLYWFIVYVRPAFYKHQKATDSLVPVSIIICARNEADNLKRFLPSVLNQDYPNFEVILVNDASIDNTEEVLFELKKQHPHLYVTHIRPDSRFQHGKKLAVSIGIKAAKNEHLLFTDADCEPASNQWAKHMMQSFGPETEIVLGYGKHRKGAGLVNRLVRLETLYTAMQYFGFAKAGMPYMGVGRNLAYKKEVFYRNGGFKGHTHILSGDDDLMVNKAATKTNTASCLHPEAFTVSETQKRFGKWFKTKRRHLSSSVYYRVLHKLILFLEPFSKILFYFAIAAWCMLTGLYISGLLLLLIHILLRFIILLANSIRFKEKYVLLLWPAFDIFIPAIYFLISLLNKVKPKNITWK